MSSEMFETLEEEIANLSEAIEKRVDKLSSTGYGEVRKKIINSIEDSLQEAQSLLQQLDSEVWALWKTVPQLLLFLELFNLFC
ncbi:unnamed protein product [Allacma fusca]|uniref:Vesicle transport v-SNARE N-terminal domain-containing protein n=1 Tax=Allacma fusca TaxID=39272 RepID=A0A8J2NV48_9HEXA|nr:unnamed protein product [Allacma fusca]